MKILVIFLTVFITVECRLHDIYKDCGSQTGSITNVSITDCDKPPCMFVRGKNYTLALNFLSKTNSVSAVNKVYGIIAKIPIPFNLPNNDACSMGFKCPIKNGDALFETVTLPILTEYPKVYN